MYRITGHYLVLRPAGRCHRASNRFRLNRGAVEGDAPQNQDGGTDGGCVRVIGSGEVPVVCRAEPDAQHGGDGVKFEGGAQVGEGLGFDAGAHDGGVGVVVCGD